MAEIDVQKIAKLARIQLKSEEVGKLSQDLNNIIGYIEKLSELNTDQVEPTSHVLQLENVFREDEVNQKAIRDDVLNAAPAREASFFKVPKVIEES